MLKVQRAGYYFTSVPANDYPAEHRGGPERYIMLLPDPTLPTIASYLANVLGSAIDVLQTKVYKISQAALGN
jgi:hypothetical protein